MTRYIDADAYLQKICTYNETGCGSCRFQTKCPADEPTIEAEPVRHGKWIPVRSYEAFGGDKIMWEIRGNPVAFYYCSECRNDAYAGEDGESLLTKYCPECGAKMEAGHDTD